MDEITLYGLKNCDTCRKALKEMEAADMNPVFIDIRTEADLKQKVPAWLDAAGVDALVNKRSTTWRNLSDDEKVTALTGEGAPRTLAAIPTLIKRPVIEADGAVMIGWSKDTKAALGLS